MDNTYVYAVLEDKGMKSAVCMEIGSYLAFLLTGNYKELSFETITYLEFAEYHGLLDEEVR